MKDIIISSRQQQIELKWLVSCLCTAILMNVCAIVFYQTSWEELYTQLLWVLILTCILYVVSIVMRIIISWIKRLFMKRT